MPTPQQQQPPAIAVSANSDSSSSRLQPSNSFVCTFCGEAFTVLFDWTRHVRKHASSIVTLNLQARNGTPLRPTPLNGEPAKAHASASQQHPESLASITSSKPSPDFNVAPTNNTGINGSSSGLGDRSATTRQEPSTHSKKDRETEAPSHFKKQETRQSSATSSYSHTDTLPETKKPMDAQTDASAPVAAKVVSLSIEAQQQMATSSQTIPPSEESKTSPSTSPQAAALQSASPVIKKPPESAVPNPSPPPTTVPPSLEPPTIVPLSPEPLAADAKKLTTTNSHRTQSTVLTKAGQSRASVSMPVASSKVTPIATRNQSRSESKPVQVKVEAPPTASSISFPMPSPAAPTPISSSSSSSSSSSGLRKTKRYRTQSDIDDEADFDITVEPLSQPQGDASQLRCLWRQTQSLSERHQQQQQGLPEMSRSKGKSRAMETSLIAETCRMSFESDIELIGHYVRHIALMETRFECPVRLCKTILPSETHLQMHLERFHPDIKSKATSKAATRRKPPSTDPPDKPRRGSSRSSTPASTSGRAAPQALQQTKQRRTRMQTKGSKTAQTAPPAVIATKRVFRESSPAAKRTVKESSPAVSAKKIKGSPPPMSATKIEIKGTPSTTLAATRDISESIANIDKALSLGAFFSPPKKTSGKMTTTRTRG